MASLRIKNRRAVAIAGAVVGLLVLGGLVGEYGNIGVRRDVADERALGVQNPLVPGTKFSVNWPYQPDEKDRSVLLVMRSGAGDLELAAARLAQGVMQADLECDIMAGNGTLLLTELLSEKVLAEAPVTVLPLGPDCLQ